MRHSGREASSTLPTISLIVGTAASWHNGLALADCGAEPVRSAMNRAFMDYLATIFVPTGNRRLNELVGFLMCVSALLLFLALVSYSPLDPSWHSASVLTNSHAARNWIGIVGAYTADAMLQFFGVGAFLLVVFPVMLGTRWFRSMKVQSPLAKTLG